MPSHCRKETPTTRCSKNSSGYHLCGEWKLSWSPGRPMLTRDWSVAADTGQSGESARVCLSQCSGLGMQPGSTLGPASPTSLFYPPGKLRQEARDLPGPQQAAAALGQDPTSSAHSTPTLWGGAQPSRLYQPVAPNWNLEHRQQPRTNPPRAWEQRGVLLLSLGRTPPPLPPPALRPSTCSEA